MPDLDTKFFGHPRGLATLFFTEMWERFSYYGMRALLILFMVAPVANGGLGFDKTNAGAIYGLYTGTVYLACLPGGWIADRIIGAKRAVLLGGILIALGHLCLALPMLNTFYFGLLIIVCGTGLLKPNVSALVGSLYAQDDIRRDSGWHRRRGDSFLPFLVHRARGVGVRGPGRHTDSRHRWECRVPLVRHGSGARPGRQGVSQCQGREKRKEW